MIPLREDPPEGYVRGGPDGAMYDLVVCERCGVTIMRTDDDLTRWTHAHDIFHHANIRGGDVTVTHVGDARVTSPTKADG